MENSVKEIRKQINALEAKVFEIEDNITRKNTVILYEEVRNLLDKIDIVEGDYYAPTRYYSRIPGVKNIRFGGDNNTLIVVKVLSPKGRLLPKEITVRNIKYDVVCIISNNYTESLDY